MDDYLNFLIGQNDAANLLRKIADSNRIPHAFLFTGIEGVGKFNAAINFLKYINEKSDKKNLLRFISKLEEPAVKLITPLPRGKGEGNDDGPFSKIKENEMEIISEEYKKKGENHFYKIFIPNSNTIKISSIRDIRKFASLEYSDLKYRAIVISEAHRMNDQAQNSLLKNLEEPPEGIIFFLITQYPGKLLPTIHSRCWKIEFNPLSEEDLSRILISKFQIEELRAKKAAAISDGSVTQALELLENDFEFLLEKTISILRYSLGRKYNKAYKEFLNYIIKQNKEIIQIIFSLILKWIDDAVKNRFNREVDYFIDYKETLIKYNKRYPNSDLSALYKAIEFLKVSIDKNINLNIIALNAIFEIGYLGVR